MSNNHLLVRRIDRRVAVSLILLLLCAFIPISAAPVQAAGYPATIRWEDNGVKVNDDASFFPWAAVDSNNRTHIAYVSDEGGLRYINNVGGNFSGPQEVEKGLKGNRDPYHALAISGNTLYVAYSTVGAGEDIFFRRGTLQGASVTWEPKRQLSAGSKAFAAHVSVDKAGNAHFVWIENRCGKPNVYYRVRQANGQLGGIEGVRADCTFQNRPQVTVTNDGKPHVVFQRDGEIYYARRDASGWSSQNLSRTGSTNSLNPTITNDGTALYMAWGEGIASGNHDVLFKRSQDGGQNWSNTIPLSNSPAVASFPHATWSESARRVYIVWADSTQDNQEIWSREFDPATGLTTDADRLTRLSNESAFPTIGAGPNKVDVVWRDKVSGDRKIYRVGGSISSAACTGSVTLNGGAAETNNPALTATITPAGCTPTEMQIAVNTPITDATPRQPFAASVPVALSGPSQCVNTVYVRLFASGGAGAPFSDDIVVDNAVTATVNATNPYLLGNPQQPQADGKAQTGDPTYSRTRQAYLSIIDSGDCKGLQEFSLPNNAAQTITNNAYTGLVALPGNETQGEKSFQVAVKDKLNNSALFPSAGASFVVTYDTDAPTLDTSPKPTITSPVTATTALVTLNFDNIAVRDNVYGARENLPAGKQFWGVWLANSRTPDADPNALTWVPVQVLDKNTKFSVQWSLLTGASGDPNTLPGDYYVYAKVLDGAGNPSTGTIVSSKMTLQPNFTRPTVLLPIIRR